MNAVTQPRNGEFFRRMAFVLLSIVTIAIFALAAMPVHAAAPAGSVIGNQATATYTDAGSVSRSATSNLVQTTVQQVKSFTLNTTPQTRTAAPGSTVYYPHYITNTGNGSDTYSLTAPTSGSFAGAPGGPHTGLAYYIDADGNGVPDNATAITTSGPLAAGGIFRFVVAGTVPASSSDAATATITVAASDTGTNSASNSDTTTVANSVINVTKSLSVSSGPSPSTGNVTVTLSYTNSGTSVANTVTITDALPASMTYVAGTGRWSVSGATALTDAAEATPEQGGTNGIRYSSTLGAGATVTAIIGQVANGVSGTLTFDVTVNSGLSPTVINNTASYTTATQASSNTNTASYTVAQTASVAFNGSNASIVTTTNDPSIVASANAGTTITYDNYVWNLGNATDTFDITVVSQNLPTGSSVQLFQQDGATTLINSSGTAAPDTGPIPGRNATCNAPFVTTGGYCAYKVVVKVTLPAGATNTGAPFNVVLRATSVFNTAVSDDMTDQLTAVAQNTVDVTNDLAAPTAGTAAAANGLGQASTNAVIKTNAVSPAVGGTATTTFLVYVTNTGTITDSFNLNAYGGTNAPLTTSALPTGWSVAFRADGGSTCGTLGGTITATNPLAANAAQLVCVVVTIPSTTSGNAAPGNYDLMFLATSQTNATVKDYVVDRVTLNTVRSITITPNNTQQTFPGGSVTYSHTITNSGNASDTATFAASCLTDSRSAQGWSSSAYIDGPPPGLGDGVLTVGTDPLITCGTTTLAMTVGEARTIFVRVFAPGSAGSTDPANVTTLTATYSTTVSATDSTSVTDGLVLLKEQQALAPASCTNNNPAAASYTTAAISASASTVPGACIAYRITATNTTAGTITAVVISDIIPPNTKIKYSCSGNGSSTPTATGGGSITQSVADGGTGTLKGTIPTLTSTASGALYFCVQID